MKRNEVDINKLSPMMKQYLEIKEKYDDTIIFFRLGDFYEMFFEDATLVSHELELTLTGKNCGLEERVPMCGVPYHAYKSYLDKLIEKGYKVAIVEQLTDPKDSKGMVERGVVQVVTKGTRIDDELNSKDYNYIGNIYDFEYCYGLSFIDISTGYSYSIIVEHNDNQVISEVLNYNLKEVIVNSKINRELVDSLRNNYNILVTIRDDILDDDTYNYLTNNVKDVRVKTTVFHLLSYLIETKKGDLTHLQEVELIDNNKNLQFDVHTKKNLELTETIRNHDRMYSLLWLLDKTKTAAGSRLLKANIENPLTDIKELNRRYDIIEKFLTEFILKEELREDLSKVYDFERIAGRITYGNCNARDMIQLKNSLQVLPDIKRILEELEYDKNIEPLDDLYNLLEESINLDAPITLHDGGLIKDGYNKELDELKNVRKNSKDVILEIEKEEKERTGIKNLKVGFNKVFGYYIEVSKGSISEVKEEYGWIRKQTLTTGERYITPLLKEKEDIILNASEKIISLEYNLFSEIRETAKTYISKIQQISKVLSEVDMLLAFSVVSEENSYIRPEIIKDHMINIKNGRHPVVEKVNKKEYVANDIIMDKTTNILLITGPNMAGKSTYMRQLAIIVIMAQIGCFVPCSECKIPVFDRIFTRIGASDDLVSGESTFMVEMKEANLAISNATTNSLILFDELGRGTATYDGIALARAILEYINNNIKAKTLFSTHYHELTVLDKELKGLKNVHVSAIEEEGKITFLHKVKNGAVDKSYGIHVASLAKLPDDLIKRANEILGIYEKKEHKNAYVQTSLFNEFDNIASDPVEDEIKKRIDSINPLEMNPMEALNFLYELKNDINKDK